MYDPEYHKRYYQENKERIYDRTHAFKWCDSCFHNYPKYYWSKHIKSQKHKERSSMKQIFTEFDSKSNKSSTD